MHWTSIFHNTIIETFLPFPGLVVSVSNGNIGLLENKLDIERGMIMTIEKMVTDFDKSLILGFKSHKETLEMKSIININIHCFTASIELKITQTIS